MAERKKVKIPVPSKDPKKEDDREPKYPEKQLKDGNKGPTEEESEEDKLLREKLEANAGKLLEAKKDDIKVFTGAVNIMTNEMQTATGSMTAVPKPLKFLNPFYKDLKAFYHAKVKLPKAFRKDLADMLAVLAMTMAEEGSREMLFFKLEGHEAKLGEWGHEFVRALCGEISQEYASLDDSDEAKKSTLNALARKIVPFLIEQNTETEAIDLLFEVKDLPFILEGKFIDDHNYERTCLYLSKFSEYLSGIEDLKLVLETTFELYMRVSDLPNALRTAIMLNSQKYVHSVFAVKYGANKEEDLAMKKQLAFMLGSQRSFTFDAQNDAINGCSYNTELSAHYLTLAENLNVVEAKSPEDVYKTHLYGLNFSTDQKVESAEGNLAATYVNGFVNCGFQHDSLIRKKGSETSSSWLAKHKSEGKIAAVASIGLINQWCPEVGINLLEGYFDPAQQDEHQFAGALLGCGLSSSGINDEAEIAFAFATEAFGREDDKRTKNPTVQICAVLGLGIAYMGNPHAQAYEMLKGFLNDDENSFAVRCFAALAIGLLYVGTGDADVACEIINALPDKMEPGYEELDNPIARFLLLGWAIIFLGKQDLEDKKQRGKLEIQLQVVSAVENRQFAKFGQVLFKACAYAGSGNVIVVQELLHLCAEHLNEDGLTQAEAESAEAEAANAEEEKDDEKEDEGPEKEKVEVDKEKAAKNAARQAAAVLGVALICFGDPVGKEMVERTFQHLLQYGDLAIRRTVPLAMALVRVSDPDYGQIEVLSKLTHDSDVPTAMSAIMGLGLMSCGTTNSRVAMLLRQLAEFYRKDSKVLLVVRFAQGLLFAGKGLVTLHPFHSDRSLMLPSSVAALLTVLVASLDMQNTLLGQYHYIMFTLSAALRPRMCLTLTRNDKNELEQVKVKVRVGQAVETVGQAGNPKKITGFQTQETPVLINVGDRVQLATDEYESYTSTLEGVVILKKVDAAKPVE